MEINENCYTGRKTFGIEASKIIAQIEKLELLHVFTQEEIAAMRRAISKTADRNKSDR